MAPVVERRSGKGERALPGAGPLLLLLLLLPQAGASGAGSALGHRPCLSPRSGGGSARGGERVGARRETGPGWGRGGPAAPGLVSPAVGPGLSLPGAGSGRFCGGTKGAGSLPSRRPRGLSPGGRGTPRLSEFFPSPRCKNPPGSELRGLMRGRGSEGRGLGCREGWGLVVWSGLSDLGHVTLLFGCFFFVTRG